MKLSDGNNHKTVKALEKYVYKGSKGGAFIHTSDKIWQEVGTNIGLKKIFKEIKRDDNYITIHNTDQDMTIKLPINGGVSLITGSERGWSNHNFYKISKEN